MAKIVAFPLAIIMSLLSIFFPCEKQEPTPEQWNSNHSYVFVHGLMGWGSYDFYYNLFPYWGTFGGYEFGEEWFENDGLVNTISAKAPTNARSKDFDANDIPKGVWNVMPTYHGDHMSLQGGLLKTNTDVERLYTEHLNMINCL
ncbi:MAG: hypothetical protein IJZ57_00855 [Clostridia bacterium]|nr:hypothetical protein [Clostridia bacterium]